LSSIQQIGEKAAEVLQAARAEAERRKIQLGGNDSAAAVA
jgi:hypothetical protein